MLTEVRGKILKCDPNLGIQLTGFTEMGYRPMYSSVARGESDPKTIIILNGFLSSLKRSA